SAAKTDDDVGIEVASHLRGLVDRCKIHFRTAACPDQNFRTGLLEQDLDPLSDPATYDVLVRADQDPLPKLLVDVPKLLEHTPPEEHSSSRRESPRTLNC